MASITNTFGGGDRNLIWDSIWPTIRTRWRHWWHKISDKCFIAKST